MKTRNILSALLTATLVFNACENDDVKPKKAIFEGGDVSGVWEKNSTYTVEGHMVVPEGESLTIEEGVTVIMANPALATEIIVNGNLYIQGTKDNPVLFTVHDSVRTAENVMAGLWGGILCNTSSEEVLINYAIFEYSGATTTEDSPSVQRGLYKAEAGEGLPLLWNSNVDGKLVVTNSIMRNCAEDIFYLEGGSLLIYNNIFHTSGVSGGEAVNIKSGCVADVAFNLFYSPNTNALKLSNADLREPQATVNAYNNTILNAGWRRPSVKGGSVWLEDNVNAKIFNNLIANCRFGVKNDDADERSVYNYNYYYGYSQTCVNQFQATESKVVRGANDFAGNTAGANDPMFENYPLNTDVNNYTLNTAWDFHLKATSPAFGKGTTTYGRNFPSGVTIKGVVYTAPAPSTTVGAFGVK
jgi:hypothetical protein